MWVVVFSAGCADASTTTIRWSFADHRTCTEANVVTVVVSDGAREIARVACDEDGAALRADVVGVPVVVEALGYHGTPLYRASVEAHAGATNVVLRFVGGR
jgi:methyl coenzyme M reductase subunit C